MANFKYVPIALRIQTKKNALNNEDGSDDRESADDPSDYETHSASGILFADETSLTCFALTCSPFLPKTPNSNPDPKYNPSSNPNSEPNPGSNNMSQTSTTSILVTCQTSISAHSVTWLPFSVYKTVDLETVNRTLGCAFLGRGNKNKSEYRLGPANASGEYNWDVTLSMLTYGEDNEGEKGESKKRIQSLLQFWNFQEWASFESLDVSYSVDNSYCNDKHDNSSSSSYKNYRSSGNNAQSLFSSRCVRVESSPFALVNPAVFVSHVVRTTLAYVAPDPGSGSAMGSSSYSKSPYFSQLPLSALRQDDKLGKGRQLQQVPNREQDQQSGLQRLQQRNNSSCVLSYRTSKPGLYLLDGRFLDGMEGGVVLLDGDDKSSDGLPIKEKRNIIIGLVIGQLEKTSGEGDLQACVPWQVIEAVIETELGVDINNKSNNNNSNVNSPPTSISPSPDWVHFNGVVLIETENRYGHLAWGSGIVVNSFLSTTFSQNSPDSSNGSSPSDNPDPRPNPIPPKYIITNNHLFNNNPTSITVWYSETQPRGEKVELLGVPLPGIDIAILSCPFSNSSPSSPCTTDYNAGFDGYENKTKSCIHAAELYTKKLTQGQKVCSMGYGLIYPRWGPWSSHGPHRTSGSLGSYGYHESRVLQPLLSNGYISNIVEMEVFEPSNKAPTQTSQAQTMPSTKNDSEEGKLNQVMAVCTSSCWNGSSGGAVFDAVSGKVVAMMTSNGKVACNDKGPSGDKEFSGNGARSKVIPELAFAIPAQVLRLAIDQINNDLMSGQVSKSTSGKNDRKVNPRIKLLWDLKETHKSFQAKL